MYRCLLISALFTIGSLGLPDHHALAQKPASASTDAAQAARGETLFTTYCSSCHNLQDDGMGPRLGGVTTIRSDQELTAFIRNPEKVIQSGDNRAVALHQRYKTIMPPFDFLKREEVDAILAYIKNETQLHKIQPLQLTVEANAVAADKLIAPVQKSPMRIELEPFVKFPNSSDKPPHTRIASMRAHPSGDGTLYVNDQNGLIYRIQNGQPAVFLDIRKKIEGFINTPGLATGLGSFAFHPDYLRNGLIYITHTEAFTGKPADYEYDKSIKVAMQWVLSEWKMKDIKSPVFEGERREMLRINVPSQVHGVQDIKFAQGVKKGEPDYGKLYIGIGDGGTTIGRHPELAHTIKSPLGTIIRIDPLGRNSRNGRYGIPSDNPFVKETDPEVWKEIWAYGFRNPHRFAWATDHGHKMIATEVGEGNVEEVNIIEKGADYGWNVREGNFRISASDLKNVYEVSEAEAGPYRAPFAQYSHADGSAISGGYVYKGDLKVLNDKFLFGDIYNGRLFYLHFDRKLSDPTIYEMEIVENGSKTDLRKLTNTQRVDMRIEYDYFTRQLYIMTKNDGMMRRVTKAYLEKEQ
ncbi:PQQ-dependent sugar dehydrogenase [Telluribacter sp. SYSU D00476]|uniref:PQQ-dependent sugar dehydrogenase n=1 Tax=Telluribacter sp. SYSU D00476 TaxID=2811430 RepID=UPI001FF3A832|nr:PQQ-dependent sugar dehydrogenase [Telluribacter sp. SYSU D00476]